MPFEFTKMHGLGNDFIVINALDDPYKYLDDLHEDDRRPGK